MENVHKKSSAGGQKSQALPKEKPHLGEHIAQAAKLHGTPLAKLPLRLRIKYRFASFFSRLRGWKAKNIANSSVQTLLTTISSRQKTDVQGLESFEGLLNYVDEHSGAAPEDLAQQLESLSTVDALRLAKNIRKLKQMGISQKGLDALKHKFPALTCSPTVTKAIEILDALESVAYRKLPGGNPSPQDPDIPQGPSPILNIVLIEPKTTYQKQGNFSESFCKEYQEKWNDPETREYLQSGDNPYDIIMNRAANLFFKEDPQAGAQPLFGQSSISKGQKERALETFKSRLKALAPEANQEALMSKLSGFLAEGGGIINGLYQRVTKDTKNPSAHPLAQGDGSIIIPFAVPRDRILPIKRTLSKDNEGNIIIQYTQAVEKFTQVAVVKNGSAFKINREASYVDPETSYLVLNFTAKLNPGTFDLELLPDQSSFDYFYTFTSEGKLED